jgi:hypothetical protein
MCAACGVVATISQEVDQHVLLRNGLDYSIRNADRAEIAGACKNSWSARSIDAATRFL